MTDDQNDDAGEAVEIPGYDEPSDEQLSDEAKAKLAESE